MIRSTIYEYQRDDDSHVSKFLNGKEITIIRIENDDDLLDCNNEFDFYVFEQSKVNPYEIFGSDISDFYVFEQEKFNEAQFINYLQQTHQNKVGSYIITFPINDDIIGVYSYGCELDESLSGILLGFGSSRNDENVIEYINEYDQEDDKDEWYDSDCAKYYSYDNIEVMEELIDLLVSIVNTMGFSDLLTER